VDLHPVQVVLQATVTSSRLRDYLGAQAGPAGRGRPSLDLTLTVDGVHALKHFHLPHSLDTGGRIGSTQCHFPNVLVLDGSDVALPHVQVDQVRATLGWFQLWRVVIIELLSIRGLPLHFAQGAIDVHTPRRDRQVSAITTQTDLEPATCLGHTTDPNDIFGFRPMQTPLDGDLFVPVGIQVYPALLFEYSRIVLLRIMGKSGEIAFHLLASYSGHVGQSKAQMLIQRDLQIGPRCDCSKWSSTPI